MDGYSVHHTYIATVPNARWAAANGPLSTIAAFSISSFAYALYCAEGWTVAAQSARGSLNYGHVNKYLSSIVSSYLERFPATDAEKSALGQAPAAHLLRRGVHR